MGLTHVPGKRYKLLIQLTMKKLLLALAVAVAAVGGMRAADTYAHDASALPKAAQTLLATHFKGTVSVVKIEKDFGRVSEYEAVLSDGTEVSFDAAGNWENIEVGHASEVPAAMIPQGVRDYVAANHKGERVVGIERERRGYDVELSNGVDMRFSSDGAFIRYDD